MTELEETYWEHINRATKMGVYLTSVEMQFIFGSQGLKADGLLVDIGANAGRFSLPAAEIMHVVAMDLDLYALRRLRLKNQDVDVIVADARFIPLKNGVAGDVIIVELLDYVENSAAAIAECARILKDGGVIFLSFGNKSSLKGKIKGFFGKTYSFSYGEISRVMKAEKFRVTKKLGFNWLPFGRNSNNPAISLFAKCEKILGLRKLVRFSPWVIIQAIKVSE
ncbi:MAG: class I SAM-dependent methyltransferase [Candidatus Bathyarchaeia archaeon]